MSGPYDRRQQDAFDRNRGRDHDYYGHQQQRDRSRSREPQLPGFGGGNNGGGRGRGGGLGRGRGGGRGRGRSGRGGERGKWKYEDRASLKNVLTNTFRLNPKSTVLTWCLYDVQIYKLRVAKNDEGQIVRDDSGQPTFTFGSKIPFSRNTENEEGVSSPKTRQILLKFQETHFQGQMIIVDGTDKAYSLQPAFDHDDKTKRPPPELGIDPDTPAAFFYVKIKKSCDEDDPDRDWVKDETVVVVLKFLGFHDGKIGENDDRSKIEAVLNALIRNVQLQLNFKGFGKRPRLFIPLGSCQQDKSFVGEKVAKKNLDLIDTARRTDEVRPFEELPAVALKLSVGTTAVNTFHLCADIGIKWIYPREANLENDKRVTVRLVNEADNSFAGVYLGSLENPRYTRENVEEIEKRLAKYTMSVEYERPFDSPWAQEMKNRNRDLEKMRRYVQKRRRLYQKVVGNNIIFPMNEQPRFTFKVKTKEGEKDVIVEKLVTVREYYEEWYNIKFKYPKLPLVRLSESEYFPAEFLYQELREAPGSNSQERIATALDLFDHFSGRDRIEHMGSWLKSPMPNPKFRPELNGDPQEGSCLKAVMDYFNNLNIGCETQPLLANTSVLNPPALIFQNRKEDGIADGSWQMNNKKFFRPSVLFSAAVLHDGTVCGSQANEFFGKLEKSFGNCGFISRAQLSDNYSRLSTGINLTRNDPAAWRRSFDEAMEKASRVYLGNQEYRMCQVKHCWDGSPMGVREPRLCLVRRIADTKENERFEALPLDGRKFLAFNSRDRDRSAFVTAQLINRRTNDPIKDPWADNICFDARGSLNRELVDILFHVVDQDVHIAHPLTTDDVQGPIVGQDSMSCPDIVFILLNTKCTAGEYANLKWQCEAFLGVQSQLIVMDHKKIFGPPYLGNIAMKLNTKLSSIGTQGSAWKVDSDKSLENIMTMGYSTTPEPGLGAKMIVSATCNLQNDFARFAHEHAVQSKKPLVSKNILKYLFSNLLAQYSRSGQDNGSDRIPKRIIVYRAGGNDGQFEEILNQEVQALKDEITRRGLEVQLTVMVAQSNHGYVITPNGESPQKNVPSGTCVVDPNFLPKSFCEDFDFLLTAHGGLKGTSKPVFYRCLYHEKEEGFHKRQLEMITYHSSFLYGTAAKAIRVPSMMRYASREGNRLLSVLSAMNFTEEEDDDDAGSYVYRFQPAARRPTESGSFNVLLHFGAYGENEHVQIPFYPNLAA